MDAMQLFGKMHLQYGPQYWWPVTEKGEAKPSYKKRSSLSQSQKLEIAIGAILAQNTNWKNVMKAIENLNNAKMLECKKLADSRERKIASLIKPSGYFNQKAKRLRLFCRHLQKNYSGRIQTLFKKPVLELREELLSLHGIGEETADDIILYAAQKPVFVVDAYTLRLCQRLFGIEKADYSLVQDFFHKNLTKNTGLFSEFHALIVEHCKQYCRKKPECEKCFLNDNCLFLKGLKD